MASNPTPSENPTPWWILEESPEVLYTVFDLNGFRRFQRSGASEKYYVSEVAGEFRYDYNQVPVPPPNYAFWEELPEDIPLPPKSLWDEKFEYWKTGIFSNGRAAETEEQHQPCYWKDQCWCYVETGEPIPRQKQKQVAPSNPNNSPTPPESPTTQHQPPTPSEKSSHSLHPTSDSMPSTQVVNPPAGSSTQKNPGSNQQAQDAPNTTKDGYDADEEQQEKPHRPGRRRKPEGGDDGGGDPSDDGSDASTGHFSFTSSMSARTHRSYKGTNYADIKENKYVAKPPLFDGTNFDDFWAAVVDNIRANPKYFESFKNRIEFSLSYFRGDALSWKQNYLNDPDNAVGDDFIDYPYNPDTDRLEMPQEKNKSTVSESDWFRFQRSLKRDYERVDSRTEARRRIMHYKQGSLSASEYFRKLDTWRRQARWLGVAFDEVIIEKLKENLSGTLLNHIYGQEHLPERYSDWKNAAIRWDQREQTRKLNQALQIPRPSSPRPLLVPPRSPSPGFSRPYFFPRPPTPGPSPAAPQSPSPVPFRSPSPARTSRANLTDEEYQRRKDKGECFGCGEKWTPGHKCSQQGQRVRAAIHMMPEEERAALLDTLATDFKSG